MKVEKERRRREAASKDRDLKNRLEDITDAATDFLWHEAQKTDSTSVDVPYEFAKHDIENMVKKSEQCDE